MNWNPLSLFRDVRDTHAEQKEPQDQKAKPFQRLPPLKHAEYLAVSIANTTNGSSALR